MLTLRYRDKINIFCSIRSFCIRDFETIIRFQFSIQFYAYWGYDLDSQSTPYECGRAFRIRMEDKNNINSQLDFIGKDALLRQKKVCS